MKIYAKDGKEFDYEHIEECLKHEAELDRKEREAKAKEEELRNAEKTRTDEIRKLYADLMEKVSSFENDYNKIVQIPAHGYDYIRSFKYF